VARGIGTLRASRVKWFDEIGKLNVEALKDDAGDAHIAIVCDSE
jgi:hypothetical protein